MPSRGNIAKRGSTWTYYVYVTDGDGSRRQVSKGGYRTRKQAEAARIEDEVDLVVRTSSGSSSPSTPPTANAAEPRSADWAEPSTPCSNRPVSTRSNSRRSSPSLLVDASHRRHQRSRRRSSPGRRPGADHGRAPRSVHPRTAKGRSDRRDTPTSRSVHSPTHRTTTHELALAQDRSR